MTNDITSNIDDDRERARTDALTVLAQFDQLQAKLADAFAQAVLDSAAALDLIESADDMLARYHRGETAWTAEEIQKIEADRAKMQAIVRDINEKVAAAGEVYRDATAVVQRARAILAEK